MSAPSTKNISEITIQRATVEDLKFAVAKGLSDFRKAPGYGLFFAAVYMIGGWAIIFFTFELDLVWSIYPMVIGFSLIGPFIATGLYEVSRRIETDTRLTWRDVLLVIWVQHRRELGWMAFVMLFIFWVWMYQIRTLVAVFFGSEGFATFDGFLTAVFTTTNGLIFLLVGHVVGAIISMVLFTLTVISCPLLLDKDVDFVSAMVASIRTVLASPLVMVGWGLFVVVLVVLSSLPAFLGLLITLPILGHATWHLYRRLLV